MNHYHEIMAERSSSFFSIFFYHYTLGRKKMILSTMGILSPFHLFIFIKSDRKGNTLILSDKTSFINDILKPLVEVHLKD